MKAPNTAPLLTKLLEKQHETRSPGLFKSGVFTLPWRCKVGSSPAPDLETLISAGEPCGRWDWHNQQADFADVGDRPRELPLNGYLPGSSIRGVVRNWALQQPKLRERAIELLGNQTEDTITPGKIEFLDAWATTPTKLTLDITNPQQRFQVYHAPQGEPQSCTPLPLYTLGNGKDEVEFTISIRGIPGKASDAEVDTVWQWTQQALHSQGLGSRTASGYGVIQTPTKVPFKLPVGYSSKTFEFVLYGQGCAGVNPKDSTDLRPSHWRGWLRSWVLRFLLGVMTEPDAELTLAELMGTLEPTSTKGCVRLQMQRGKTWGISSDDDDAPIFYTWKGQLHISAPTDILEEIITPIMRFAVSVGGVGRGWRRPLHIFHMNNGRAAARGTLLKLAEKVPNLQAKKFDFISLLISPNDNWTTLYLSWLEALQKRWKNRVLINANLNPQAEAFAPNTCAVYSVPGPIEEPINRKEQYWDVTDAQATRGDGMDLIYTPRYKGKPDVGGEAGNGKASCSWVSIRRLESPFLNSDGNLESQSQEIVCLFMGGQTIDSQHLRTQFLRAIAERGNHVFGVHPTSNQ